MHNSKISIIVPVYNVEQYLQKCIDSIIAQTYTNFELLLINDGCTDESGIICDKYALIDKRIRVFHKKNGGVSTARNMGLDYATGEYIAWVDSDDWIENNMYEILYNAITKENADVAWCDYFNSYMDEEIYVATQSDFNNDKAQILQYYIQQPLTSLCNTLISRNLYEQNKIRCISGINYTEDFNISIKLYYYAKKCTHVKKALYHYIQYNTNSITKATNTKDKSLNDKAINNLDVICFFKKNNLSKYEKYIYWRLLNVQRPYIYKRNIAQWRKNCSNAYTYIFSNPNAFFLEKAADWFAAKGIDSLAHNVIYIFQVWNNIKSWGYSFYKKL